MVHIMHTECEDLNWLLQPYSRKMSISYHGSNQLFLCTDVHAVITCSKNKNMIVKLDINGKLYISELKKKHGLLYS
jgi:hypothetical protein